MSPRTVTCPSCATALKLPDSLPPGKRIRCPRCSTPFLPGEAPAVEENATRPGPEGPRPGAGPSPRPAGARPVAEDEDDLPVERRAEEPRPRRKRDERPEADDDREDRPPREPKQSNVRKILVRALGAVSALALLCGLGGVCTGLSEKKLGSNATAEPVELDLARLEDGEWPTNNHVKIGPHYACYGSLIYSEASRRQRRSKSGAKIEYSFYPIISLRSPDGQVVEKLAKKHGGLKEVPDDELPPPKSFAVLVKTKRYKTAAALPDDDVARHESVQGLVVNEVQPLDAGDRQMIKANFPDVDLAKVVVIEDGRKPLSGGATTVTLVAGGAFLCMGLVGLLGAVLLALLGRK